MRYRLSLDFTKQSADSMDNPNFHTKFDVCRTVHLNIFYRKTNQMHNISNLFYFGTTSYMFRTVSSFVIRSRRLYIQHQVYVIQVLWLLASGMFHLVPASKQPQNLYNIYLMLYVQS